MTALMIAGTDTDVGKTFVTIALAAYWQKYHLNQTVPLQNVLTIQKLMQTGVGDVELYQRLFSEVGGIQVIPPLRFAAPLAPPLAAAQEGKEVDLRSVWSDFQTALKCSTLVLVESLGGLGSPVTYELTVGQIAADWRLPTVLVVPVKLGAIANTVANVALARSLKVDLKGIILNCTQPEAADNIDNLAPPALLQSLTNLPVLGTLPYAKDWSNSENIAQTVANWDLELILPRTSSMVNS